MSAPTPLTPSIGTRQKPQAKSLSPVSRNLFGQSDPTIVKDMMSDMLLSERSRASSQMNFDILKQKPIKYEQQENIVEIDRTPEARRRYVWKKVRPADAPEFYSRRCKGKKLLMPVDFSNYSPEPANASGRSRSVRRCLNGFLSSIDLEQKSTFRSSSACQVESSPLRAIPLLQGTHSPVPFDDSTESRIPAALPRPMAIHASVVNGQINRVFTPVKSIDCHTVARSPLSHRVNQSGSPKVSNFTTAPMKSLFFTAPKQVAGINIATSSVTERTSDSSITVSTNASKPPSMKQLRITDIATMRKSRSPSLKARKRLNLCEDSTSGVASAKTPKLSRSGN